LRFFPRAGRAATLARNLRAARAMQTHPNSPLGPREQKGRVQARGESSARTHLWPRTRSQYSPFVPNNSIPAAANALTSHANRRQLNTLAAPLPPPSPPPPPPPKAQAKAEQPKPQTVCGAGWPPPYEAASLGA